MKTSRVRLFFVLLSSFPFQFCDGAKVTERVYFDLKREGGGGEDPEDVGRVVVGLFGDDAPLAVRNFVRFATTGVDGRSYRGTRFHRVVRKFAVQGGDVVFNNGSGSLSMYGSEFGDENLESGLDVSGLVSMANRGPDTNGCQFFINTVPVPWLAGRHTVFGKVVEGQEHVHAIEHSPTDSEDRLVRDVFVSDCGTLPTPEPFHVSDRPYDLRAWIKASSLPLSMSFGILALFQWMIRKMEI